MSESSTLASSAAGLQEQLIASLLSSLVPANALDSGRKARPEEVPALNLATLTTNFRKFSSRIGFIFKAQVALDSIYRWKHPRETLSYGMVWTLLCIQPYLVLVIPFCIALFCLLVPSFLQLHPPPPSNIPLPPDLEAWTTNSGHAKHFGGTAEGRDFLLNMRDIQNAMDDYTKTYDDVSLAITQYANFADEKKSSVTLFVCVVGTIVSLLVAAYVPFRLVSLLCGWIALLSGHPSFKDVVRQLRSLSRKSQERLVTEISRKVDDEYIPPEATPEVRLVCVYEYRRGTGEPFYSGFSTIGNAGSEDEYVTSNLENVQAPPGYAFVSNSRWTIVQQGRDRVAGQLQITTLRREVIRRL